MLEGEYREKMIAFLREHLWMRAAQRLSGRLVGATS